MPFPIQIDVLDFIYKGLIIGVLASAGMGPVGVLTIQRTLNKGRWYGFITGVGAAMSDIIYALVTGLGLSFVVDFISDPRTVFYLQLGGAVLLMLFGIHSYRSDPTKKIHKSKGYKGTYIHNFWTAFSITFVNPLIIFIFLACFAQFAFIVPDHPLQMAIGFICIFCGAILWWFGLTWIIDKVREKFDENGIRLINQSIGAVVVLVSLIVFFGTLTNLYTFHY